jgi:hypothetical protein
MGCENGAVAGEFSALDAFNFLTKVLHNKNIFTWHTNFNNYQ